MSTEISRPVSCPRCGEAVETRMWPGINAEVNPNLREQVLQETLFNWTCPACGYVAQMAYPCLYHDKGRKLMARSGSKRRERGTGCGRCGPRIPADRLRAKARGFLPGGAQGEDFDL